MMTPPKSNAIIVFGRDENDPMSPFKRESSKDARRHDRSLKINYSVLNIYNAIFNCLRQLEIVLRYFIMCIRSCETVI
jgi:hypothetical protein